MQSTTTIERTEPTTTQPGPAAREIRVGDEVRYIGDNAFHGLLGTVRAIVEGESGDYVGPMLEVELREGQRRMRRRVRIAWLEKIEAAS